MMKLYYLLIFAFLAAMVVMWAPQLFTGLLIFIAVLTLAGVLAWFWFRRRLKTLGVDLQKQMQEQMLSQMMGQMPGQNQDAAGADLFSQIFTQMQNGQNPMAEPGPTRRPRPISHPTDGPVIYVKPEEIQDR